MLLVERNVALAPSLAAEEVDALVIRDAKEPRLETGRVLERRKIVECLSQRLLDEVLAIQRRAAHARAESVQPRPHGAGGGHELFSDWSTASRTAGVRSDALSPAWRMSG